MGLVLRRTLERERQATAAARCEARTYDEWHRIELARADTLAHKLQDSEASNARLARQVAIGIPALDLPEVKPVVACEYSPAFASQVFSFHIPAVAMRYGMNSELYEDVRRYARRHMAKAFAAGWQEHAERAVEEALKLADFGAARRRAA